MLIAGKMVIKIKMKIFLVQMSIFVSHMAFKMLKCVKNLSPNRMNHIYNFSNIRVLVLTGMVMV